MKTDLGVIVDLAAAYENRTGKKPQLVQVPRAWLSQAIPREILELRSDFKNYLWGMELEFGDKLGVGRREVIGGTTFEYWQWQS